METSSAIFKRLSQDKSKREIAYFTMEAALDNDIPSWKIAGINPGMVIIAAALAGKMALAIKMIMVFDTGNRV